MVSTFHAAMTVVSTHSRLKAAGCLIKTAFFYGLVSTHSRLKAAGPLRVDRPYVKQVSTHSRLKAAGWARRYLARLIFVFQHTAA